jgi:hypothetical protein
VSEVEPASEKSKPKELGCVRSLANIGQGKAKRARMCPKSSPLQTRESQKSKDVSEVEPTSDKGEPKGRDCVRSRINFRQGRAKRARKCPKSNQLQTRESQKDEIVSEVEPTSDKAEPKEQGGVRSRTNIGQGKAKRAKECPKSNQHRTKANQKRVMLSEEIPNKHKYSVKICPVFFKHFFIKNCR